MGSDPISGRTLELYNEFREIFSLSQVLVFHYEKRELQAVIINRHVHLRSMIQGTVYRQNWRIQRAVEIQFRCSSHQYLNRWSSFLKEGNVTY